MYWPESTIAVLDAAAAAARRGHPTVLAVEGAAGFGKSTLLRTASAGLEDFHVLRAYGEENAQDDRFQLLAEWDPESSPQQTIQGARLLTRLVGDRQLTGPVALVVDDLQWVDPESVDALAAVVERAAGDRLLVLTAHRPLGTRHARWRRLGPSTLRLEGLDPAAAAALVDSVAPDAPAGLAEALRIHTGGSPLHMRALLQEHAAGDLAARGARGELPAPADLAAALDRRVVDLAPDAARLLRALAVLGDGWSDVPTAAAVGSVDDVEGAVRVLAAENLVRVDRIAVVPRLRISHAVLRTAAYETMPGAVRRRLHRAAAARLGGTGDRLRHRLAATPGPDDGLVCDLVRHADDLYTRSRYREAARFRRLAARVAPTAAGRERLQLDADVESIVARDVHDVSFAGLDERSSAQRRFVHALRLSATRRWVEAARVLDDVDPDALEPVNAYRARILRGWTVLGAGRPAAQALPPLEEAAAAAVPDRPFHGLFVMTYGNARQLVARRDDPMWGIDDIRGVERSELATSPEGLGRLSWRGAVRALTGATGPAIDDLTVVTQRIEDGAMDVDDGVSRTYLGLAQWCRGEWRRSSITLGLAMASAGHLPPHPTVLAAAPLIAIVTGEDPRASVSRSRDARLAGPAPSVVYLGDIVDVAALAFCGTVTERRGWRERRRADFGPVEASQLGRVPLLWLLVHGLGAVWAGDADATETWAEALAVRDGPGWRTNAIAWLRALAARERGEVVPCDVLAARGLADLGSFSALLWADAAAGGSPTTVRDQALVALVGLDAERHAATLLPEASVSRDPLAMLSEREREVASLLLEGLSYAQIARELFVTRSTVAFHLSNVYAKTATSSRHEFVQRHRRVQ